MTNLVPMLTSINCIKLVGSNIVAIFKNEYSELAMPMLTSANVLVCKFVSVGIQEIHYCFVFQL
jgi:hypothetical protein